MGIGAKHNILIKDAATLEGIGSLDAVALDKTGTLTEGRPTLTDVVAVGETDETELLRLVAAAERGSEHPLARALVEGAEQRGIDPVEASQFEAVPGHGCGRQPGSARPDRQQAPARGRWCPGRGAGRAAAFATEGKTAMLVAFDGQPAELLPPLTNQAERREGDRRPQGARTPGRADLRRQQDDGRGGRPPARY